MIYSYTGSKARTKNYNYRFLISHLQGFPYWRDGGGGGGGAPPPQTPAPPGPTSQNPSPHWKLWTLIGHSLSTGHSFPLPGNSTPSRLPPHQSSFAPVPFLF